METEKPIEPNRKELSYYFKKTNRMFNTYPDSYILDRTVKGKRRVFVDNQAPVLFVAHLDTVCRPKFNGLGKDDKNLIYAAGLDDRLGAYAIDLLVYEFGLNADILLTDLEETGQTTAEHHHCKDYNWIAEFDRRGADVVTYGLSNADFDTALQAHFEIGFGSFSDISSLKSDACAVNVGIGYYDAHSPASYFKISEFASQLTKFKAFYNEHVNTKFKRETIRHYHKSRCAGFGDDYNYGYGYRNKWSRPNTPVLPVHDEYDDFYNPRFDRYEIETEKKPKALKNACCYCGATEDVEHCHSLDICENCFVYMLEESGIEAFKGYNL